MAEGDKAREEFFSEAQELIDGLGRDLLAIDELGKSGRTDPELVNDVFRAVHTLKGLSGLFGATLMSGLSHELEDMLDELRLGRLELTPNVLDLLFRAVELYAHILAAERGDSSQPEAEVKALLLAFGQMTQHHPGAGASPVAQYELDPGLLGVLTEYEEHRLRANIQSGVSLFRLRVEFQLATIDSALEELKARARPHGEIVTYLPTGSGGDPDTIELEILMASRAPIEELRAALGSATVHVEEVKRRGARTVAPPGAGTGVPQAIAWTEEAASAAQGPRTLDEPPAFEIPGMSPRIDTRQRIGSPAISREEPPSSMGGPLTTSAFPATAGGVEPSDRTPGPPRTSFGASASPSVAPPDFFPGSGGVAGGGGGGPGSGGSIPPSIPPGARDSREGRDMVLGRGDKSVSLRSVSQTVRVDIRKLDRLMNIVGELAIVRTALGKVGERVRNVPEARELGAELYRLQRAFERHLAQMQSGILEVRMVPLGQAFDKLARIVRQISREHDKQVHLVVTGADTEIDKLIVEELSDPLMHMIRNAIDHGIESREERIRVGKPAVGTIALNAFQKGNHVVLEVEDDGAGMNPKALVAAAVERGLLTTEAASGLSTREILQLVFLPGFTTRREANDISGRGLGMDIVKTNIAKLGGVIDISSEIGIGTKMTITLPITLAIISVLLVEVGGRTFAMPLASVEEAIVFEENNVRSIDGREVLNQRGRTLPICRLGRLFGLRDRAPAPEKQFVMIASVGNRKVGFVVDKLFGQQDIVIKALGRSLAHVRGFAGATELGDQRVALVLDAAALIEEVLTGDKERVLAEGRA